MTQSDLRLPGIAQALCLLGLAVLVLLSPALEADILNLDDNRMFGAGSELDAAGWWGAVDPACTIADAYLPVSHLSLLIDTRVFGGSPTIAHLHSLLLHVSVAFVLARLLGWLGLSRWAATAAAAVFLVHPALVESALWISSRKDLLSGLFGFLALGVVARIGVREEPTTVRVGELLAAGLLALAACYSKGTAIVLGPVAFGIAWLTARQRPGAAVGGRLRLQAAWVVLAVCFLAAVHHALVAAGVGTMGGVGGPESRWLQVPGAFAHYVSTVFWPVETNVLYPEVQTMERFRSMVLPGAVLLVLWGLGMVVARVRRPTVTFGLAAFGVALLPFNTAFPATALAAADRYLYLALPWVVLASAALVGNRLAPWILGALVLPLAVVANGRAGDFRDSEALWTSSLDADPANAVARLNLASARLEAGAPLDDDLVELFRTATAVARYPQHVWRAERRMALALEAVGKADEAYGHASAAADALKGLPTEPRVVELRVQQELAAARLARLSGRDEAARAHLEQAEALDADAPLVLAFRAALLQGELAAEGGIASPDDPRLVQAGELLDRAEAADPMLYEVYWTRGLLALSAGRLLAADKALLQAIALDPARVEAHLARCDLYLGQPDMAATAEGAARQALQLGANDPQVRSRLAYALFQQGRFGDARAHYEAYLRLRPSDQRARHDLAAVLSAVGHQRMYQSTPEENLERADRILELDPANLKALKMKAFGLRAAKRLDAALVLLERLRAERPEDREVHQLLGETLRDLGWVAKLDGEDEKAFELFRRFLDEKAPGVPTDAVETALLQEWKKVLRAGQQALLEDDLEAAERAFRRCLELRPEDASPQLQLGMTLLVAGEPEVALAAFEAAEIGQRARGADPSLAVFYRLKSLRLAGRPEEAAASGARYLEDPPGNAAEETLQRIRALLAD